MSSRLLARSRRPPGAMLSERVELAVAMAFSIRSNAPLGPIVTEGRLNDCALTVDAACEADPDALPMEMLPLPLREPPICNWAPPATVSCPAVETLPKTVMAG